MSQDIIQIIRERIGKGSQRDFAQLLGVSPSYLSDVLKGRRDAGPKVLAALGLKRVVSYLPAGRSRKAATVQ
jgi:DNA-binding transcriptional regulator YdaS (Cro superfamily)